MQAQFRPGHQEITYIIERVEFKPTAGIDFKIQNIVGMVDVGFHVCLEEVVFAHPMFFVV
jgi:TATA-box binding protein (TBP) (component of TFIID and TFIIIB)